MMNRKRLMMGCFVVGFILIAKAGWAMNDNEWEPLYLQDHPQRMTALKMDRDLSGLWLGLPGELRRYDKEGRWIRPSFFLPAQDEVVSLYTAQGHVLAAAGDSVYKIDPITKEINQIFSSGDAEGSVVFDALEVDGSVYAATQEGVFFSLDESGIWGRLEGLSMNKPVFTIKRSGSYLYFAGSQAVYRMGLEDRRVQRIFSSGLEEDVLEDAQNGEKFFERDIKALAVGVFDGELAVVSSSGIFDSRDAGENWKRISDQGITAESIQGILFFNDQLPCHGEGARSANAIPQDVPPGPAFLAWGDEGVFIYGNGIWKPIYRGMAELKVKSVEVDPNGRLVALTDQGVYSLVQKKIQVTEHSLQRFSMEPEISDVQRMAIRYAGMDPSKIQRWHRQSRMKALVPSFSLGVDRNSSELWHWDTGQSPDNMIKGRELTDWDLSLSWDLSDIVWSSDQTSIDSRAKLLTELREDVLSQVTRIYFERRRLQIESEGLAGGEQVWAELRIEELTALLDAYTGGEFSRGMTK